MSRSGNANPMDDYLTKARGVIARCGWLCQGVFAVEPDHHGYTYTVGLSNLPTAAAHPEVVVFGLPSRVAQGILNRIGDEVRGGAHFVAGRLYDDLIGQADGSSTPCEFLAVPEAERREYLGVANAILGGPHLYRALQLVWPDETGLLPWEDGFDDAFRAAQPLMSHWVAR